MAPRHAPSSMGAFCGQVRTATGTTSPCQAITATMA